MLQLAGTTHEYFLTGVAVPFLFRPAPSVGVRIERLLDLHFRDRWASPHSDWARPCHICAGTAPGTAPTCTTSAPGPGPPPPHLLRDLSFREPTWTLSPPLGR
jgi:hypothetical protein